MKWFELIKRLVDDAGGTLPVAKAMKSPSFQGTLHKVIHGNVKSPSRGTAERIAKHFQIPVDVMYSDKVAKEVFDRLFPSEGVPAATDAAQLDLEVPAFSLKQTPEQSAVLEEPPSLTARFVELFGQIDQADLKVILPLMEVYSQAQDSKQVMDKLTAALNSAFNKVEAKRRDEHQNPEPSKGWGTW